VTQMTDHERLRRITRLQFGTKNYVVGQKGVKMIEVQPPLAGVEYDNGEIVSIYSPMEPMFWYHEDAGPMLAVPNKEIVTP